MPDMIMPQVSQSQPTAKPVKALEKAPVVEKNSSSDQSFSNALETKMKPEGEATKVSTASAESASGSREKVVGSQDNGNPLPATGNPAEAVLAALTQELDTDTGSEAAADANGATVIPLLLTPAELMPTTKSDLPAANARAADNARGDWLQAQFAAWSTAGKNGERQDSAQTALAQAVREVLTARDAVPQDFDFSRFGQEVRAMASALSRPATLEAILERVTSSSQPTQGTNSATIAAPTLLATEATAVRPTLPTTTLDAPFRQAGWDQALSERVVWIVNQKFQGAEIKLNPPHLGPIEVRIHMQHDQAQVSFTAQHGIVREALEAALPRLRELFAANGLDLGDVNVSQQSFAEGQRQMSDPGSEGNFHAATGMDEAGDELAVTEQSVTALGRATPQGIDLFA